MCRDNAEVFTWSSKQVLAGEREREVSTSQNDNLIPWWNEQRWRSEGKNKTQTYRDSHISFIIPVFMWELMKTRMDIDNFPSIHCRLILHTKNKLSLTLSCFIFAQLHRQWIQEMRHLIRLIQTTGGEKLSWSFGPLSRKKIWRHEREPLSQHLSRKIKLISPLTLSMCWERREEEERDSMKVLRLIAIQAGNCVIRFWCSLDGSIRLIVPAKATTMKFSSRTSSTSTSYWIVRVGERVRKDVH